MKGDIVVVRAFGGRAHIRRVWEATPEAVYVCSEERFHRLANGQEEIPPTPFPPQDVFVYDAALKDALLSEWQTDPSLWDRLTVYGETAHD